MTRDLFFLLKTLASTSDKPIALKEASTLSQSLFIGHALNATQTSKGKTVYPMANIAR
jgi:hypothetical protein